jgi:hypothetical protein
VILAVSLLSDLLVPIALAFAGASVAALWPSIQGWRHRRRLTGLIRRELREIGPLEPAEGKDWWEHLDKRFIHEEFFKRENVIQNRDFLLSLPPSLVYHTSQLWIAFDKQDLDEWRWHLRRLIEDKSVGNLSTEEAQHALARWDHFAETGAPTVPAAGA